MLCDTQCGAVNCLSYDVILTGQDMDYIKDLFQLYNDNGMLMLLYVIGWLLIVVLERKKVNKVVFAYSAWYLPLVILNPLVGMVLQRLDILPYRMVRIYWLLPVFWVIAYGLTILVIQSQNVKKWMGTLVALLAVAVLVFVGKPIVTDENFVKNRNIYKLPEEVIEVVDKINADYDAGLSDSRKVVMPLELAVYARLYDGSVPLLYGRLPDTDESGVIFAAMGYDALDMQVIADGALKLGCGYLVLDSEKACQNAPQKAQVTEFARVGKYCLYRLN